MTEVRWSPADLNQQRLVVRRIAVRSELNRERLAAARAAFGKRLRDLATSPLVVGGVVVAGFLLFRPSAGRKGTSAVSQVGRKVRSVTATVMWLTHMFRQFQSGIAAGAALSTRPRASREAPGGGPYPEQ
jgi:hypothetical protein